MLGGKKTPVPQTQEAGGNGAAPVTLLTIAGDSAKVEGKFEIADSIQIECEIGGEPKVGGRLVIGQKGGVNAQVKTVDAVIMGHYQGNMAAPGHVEIPQPGPGSGTTTTD